VITCQDLEAGYGRIRILNGVSLEIASGSAVGILGHNGMGKTTLLRTLMGLIPATAGTVHLDGHDITQAPTHARARRGLAYVPQGRQIFPGLTVAENLRMAAVAAGKPPATVERVLTEFPELTRLLDRSGGALSGGEQQLLALARALCTEPRLLLLDEPTEGIQPSIVQAIVERLASLRRSRGVTLLLVEQSLDFIHALSDRVLLIQRGRIVRELAPDALEAQEILDAFVGVAA
jgi:branched-chain amino acid transport system ATP-binding protein